MIPVAFGDGQDFSLAFPVLVGGEAQKHLQKIASLNKLTRITSDICLYLFQSSLTDTIVFNVELLLGTFHHAENAGPLQSSILW